MAKRYKSDEGYYEGNPRDDDTFHDEILRTRGAARKISEIAVSDAIKDGLTVEAAKLIYGMGD